MINRNDSFYARSALITVTYFCICFVLVVSVKLKPEWGGYYLPGTVCTVCTNLGTVSLCLIFMQYLQIGIISLVLPVRKLRPKEVKQVASCS